MRESTKPTSTTVAVVLAMAVALLAVTPRSDAREPLDVDGTSWSFSPAAVETKARARGMGTMKQRGGEYVTLTLLPGDAWSVDVGSTLVLSGGRTRRNEFSKRLALSLDAPSASALAALYVEAIEAAAALEGVDLTLSLAVERSKIVVRVRPSRRAGTATATLKAKFKLLGTASAAGAGSVPASVRITLRGASVPVPFGG